MTNLLRRILRTSKGQVLLAALVAAIGWQAWLSVDAPRKLSSAELKDGSGKVNLLVTLNFPPEQFHIITFQCYGRISGTQDNTVELRGVKKSDVLSVARPYWVTKVAPLPTEGQS